MTRYRPSKSFMLSMLGLCPLLIGSAYFLYDFNHASKPRPMMYDGPIRMVIVGDQPPPPVRGKIGQAWDAIKQWKHNPWKSTAKPSAKPAPTVGIGDHFFEMEKSTDPRDQARCRELYRLSAVWMENLLIRHPDMALPVTHVPDDQNGYLKWLAFTERFKKPGSHDYESLKPPKELTDFLYDKSPWPAEIARTWLTQQKPLLDEIRAIGVMPQRSNRNLTGPTSMQIGGLTKSCADALMIEARLAAAEGNAEAALESIRAANGIADHLSQVEIPCLYNETVSILIRLSLQGFTFSKVLTALPAERIDSVAWETALHPTVSSPAEFSRILKGEYHFGMRVLLLPILADAGDPHPLPDPEEFIDVYTEMYRRCINANPSHDPKHLPTYKTSPLPSSAGLSEESRNFYEGIPMHVGAKSWQKGWTRAQSAFGMTQAAFAIMKGLPVPVDPIFSLPYDWNPATRTLSAPSSPAFDEMALKPIIVPKL